MATGSDYTENYYSAMNTLITLHHMCSLGDCMYTWASECGHMKALTVQLPVQVVGVCEYMHISTRENRKLQSLLHDTEDKQLA